MTHEQAQQQHDNSSPQEATHCTECGTELNDNEGCDTCQETSLYTISDLGLEGLVSYMKIEGSTKRNALTILSLIDEVHSKEVFPLMSYNQTVEAIDSYYGAL